MMPTLDDVRHIRGFGVTIERTIRTTERLKFQWAALEEFRATYPPTIKNSDLRAFIEDQIDRRIGRHPLRRFSTAQAFAIEGLAKTYARELRH